MKIIIAEDEEDIRTILTINLEDAGHQITTAADGEECLKKVWLCCAGRKCMIPL